MQCDAVAFAVEHDGAKAVRTDAFHRLQHPATMLFYLRKRVANAAVDIHVDEDTGRAHLFRVGNQAAAVAGASVLEHGEAEIARLLAAHLDAEHRGIEAACALELGHRQGATDDTVRTRMHLAHFPGYPLQWNRCMAPWRTGYS